MSEQLENKLTAISTYKTARNAGFGRFNSAYFAIPVVMKNFASTSKEMLTPTIQRVEVDRRAKTYHIVEESAVFGEHIAQTYAHILELKGYKKV